VFPKILYNPNIYERQFSLCIWWHEMKSSWELMQTNERERL